MRSIGITISCLEERLFSMVHSSWGLSINHMDQVLSLSVRGFRDMSYENKMERGLCSEFLP